MKSSHIGAAISIYEKLATYDLSIYGELILCFLKCHNVKTTEDFKIFLSMLSLTTDADLYCKINNNTLEILNKGKDDEKINISVNEIENEAKNITPKNLHSSSSTTNIVKALLFIKKVHEKDRYRQLQTSDLSDTEFESILLASKEKISTFPNAIVELVKLSLSLADENKNLKRFTNRICTQLFGHIGKSILNAEYLIFDEYSSSLQR